MASDSDQLDDIFADIAVKNARPVGKFQPKLKLKPPKKYSASTSGFSSNTVQTSDTELSKLTDPVKTAELSDHRDTESIIRSLEKDPSKDIEKASVSLRPNLDESGRRHAHMEKSVEVLSDLLPQRMMEKEVAAPSVEAGPLNVPNAENLEGSDVPVVSFVGDSTYTSNGSKIFTSHELLEEGDPLITGMTISSRGKVGVCINDRECERNEMSIMDSIDFSELTTTPVQRTGKFQPRPKVMQKEVCVASTESGPNSPLPPEIDSTEKDPVPAFLDDDVIDLSSIGLTDGVPVEGTSDFLLNEESMNLMEMTQLDPDIHLEDVPEVPAKLVSRRAKTGMSGDHFQSDLSQELQQQNACSSGQENESDRVLRPRKSRNSFCELDEAEDVDISDISDKHPVSSAAEEETHHQQFQQESESKEKKTRQKSGKPDEDKEKPGKKRKKAKEASALSADAKRKKFSHSTRRRQVDKVLLETPEHEIDYQKVPIRDLILLAEHKERQMKKEEAAAKPATKQSNGNSSAFHYEDETFTSREGEEYNDEEASPMVEENIYYNYQTYMDRTPTVRWSKQDTELFYEALRQFGTDLSMIQHLFPGRTRRQMKLKYKREEKQHPLRLRDALTTHTKDISKFQIVINRLKQIAAEEKQNADKGGSVDLTGEEEVAEGTSHADEDGEAKNEQMEEEENEDVAAHDLVQETESYDSEEDDLLLWSQYKSET